MVDEVLDGNGKLLKDPFKTLIAAAVLAPSGDNMQPWRFEVDEAESTITIFVDETRDRSPMNAGQRMARIACGAATYNMLRTAKLNGWQVNYEIHESPIKVATLHVPRYSTVVGEIDVGIRTRHTNRRAYYKISDSRTHVTPAQGFESEFEDVRSVLVADGPQKKVLTKLVGTADQQLFQLSGVLKAFLASVRIESKRGQAIKTGLPSATLELGQMEQKLLQILTKVPAWVVKSPILGHVFRHKASQLARRASGFYLLLTEDNRWKTDVKVGMTVQSLWLNLHERGFAIQPMMSLPVLDSIEYHNGANCVSHTISNLCRSAAASLEFGNSRIAAILRFGTAKPASGRSRRAYPSVRWVTNKNRATAPLDGSPIKFTTFG